MEWWVGMDGKFGKFWIGREGGDSDIFWKLSE